jgi:hypothetical protein
MGPLSRGIAEVSQTHILDKTFTGMFTTYEETRHRIIIFFNDRMLFNHYLWFYIAPYA